MPVETLSPFVTPTPDLGGTYKPNFNLNDTIVMVSSDDRFSPPQEPQKPTFKPVESARDLIMKPIPKWDMAMEMSRLVGNINTNLAAGKTLSEAVTISAGELEINIRSYNSEIIQQKPVLPHLNRLDFKNGVLRMVGHNGEPVVDAITAEERKGSVLEASRLIEDFLVTSPDNSFAVLMNPAGWNGFLDKNGRPQEHLNAEPMVFWKNQKGELKGLTFHIDLEQEKARKVMLNLGVSEYLLEGGTEQERIANMVRNPALLSLPEAYANPFVYAFDKILAERGQQAIRLLQHDKSTEVRSIEEVRESIESFEELLSFSQNEEEYIAQLIGFIIGDPEGLRDWSVQQEIVYKIGKTLLKLTREHLQERDQKIVYQPRIDRESESINRGLNISSSDDNYDRERAYLETRGGCPPGGSSGTRALRGISLGIEVSGATMPSTVTLADLEDPDFCIHCGACGEYIWCIVRHGEKCPKCPAIRKC